MADSKGQIEELAQANLKPVPADPCALWDDLVRQKMAADDCVRSIAVDRLLSTAVGSDAWQKCCAYDAAQPKILADGSKSGNWKNQGNGFARRVPRQP
jgi:hypothetical protein